MTYAKIEDGQAVEYPVYEGDLERLFPQYKFPLDSNLDINDGLTCPEGYAKVVPNQPTTISYKLKYSMGMPALDEDTNTWKEVWNTEEKTEEELSFEKPYVARAEREKRDKLLMESDKYILSDRWQKYTEQEKTEWSDYRQDLRDVPEQVGFPYDINWPLSPSVFSVRDV